MLRFVLVALFVTSACRMSLDDDGVDPGDGGSRLCQPSATVPECVAAKDLATSAKLSWIEPNIFNKNCQGPSCHGPGIGGNPPAGRIVLTTQSHGKLVNADNMLAPGRLLVVPGSVPKSYLMVILRHLTLDQADPAPAPEPARMQYMPQGTPPICCEKLDALERWITDGAQMN